MKKVYLKKKKVNIIKEDMESGDIQIAPQFMDAYLSLLNQQQRLQKQMNQYQKQMNDINNKILQIKQKSANELKKQNMQAAKQPQQTQQPAQQVQQPAQQAAKAQQQIAAQQQVQGTSESVFNDELDKLWEAYINEDTEIDLFGDESLVDFGNGDADLDDFYNEEDEDDDYNPFTDEEENDDEKIFDDDLFVLKIKDENDKLIIAKFYKNSSNSLWKVRIVEGSKEPLESMQFEKDMDKLDIIEKIEEFPGFDDVEEMDIKEYEDIIDDKEEIDKKYHDDEEDDEETEEDLRD